MALRTPLFIVALGVIAFGLYLLVKVRSSKTTLKISGIGEISTASVGLVTLVIGVVLSYFCIQADERRENAAEARKARERQAAVSALPPPPSASVSQSSTGDGSPNIGVVTGGSVTVQVDKSKAER
ncbi:hypothetical protein [Paucibacter sp. M5-1]|uniref:hypothetical protein n=1 Tax=Paucibacter sp. M5-1 TaxID=3015998 RepID=UPI0022B86A5C|nr:hypothetical protein [Paucibacter sp. M5-1]MCZ7881897.1 hypothetical protein [Paucibacter sp. M5-1]